MGPTWGPDLGEGLGMLGRRYGRFSHGLGEVPAVWNSSRKVDPIRVRVWALIAYIKACIQGLIHMILRGNYIHPNLRSLLQQENLLVNH